MVEVRLISLDKVPVVVIPIGYGDWLTWKYPADTPSPRLEHIYFGGILITEIFVPESDAVEFVRKRGK